MENPKLSLYRSKRDFGVTGEPRGARRTPRSDRLRFVIQKHDASRLHYDFRLELGGVLKSWAVTRGPSLNPRDKRLAVEVEDHPLDYGDFEGTIPKGEYGGGTVQLWDRGYWTPEGDKSPEQALADGDLKFTLDGERLHGSWVLVRMRDDRAGSKRHNWLLIKHRDGSARESDGDALLSEDRSVASGRSMTEIAAGAGPAPSPFITGTAPAADAKHASRPAARRASPAGTAKSAVGKAAKAATARKPAASRAMPAGDATQRNRTGAGRSTAEPGTSRKVARNSAKPARVAAPAVTTKRPAPRGGPAVSPRTASRTGQGAVPGAGATSGDSRGQAATLVMGVALSKPEKTLWPETDTAAAVTKLDLARYYETVGPWMMQHLKGRPCGIVRGPNGIRGPRFFQRHAMPGDGRGLTQVQLDSSEEPYLQVDGVEGLIALAQAAALELHPWNCQPGQPLVPGRLVFDLDPGPDVPFTDVVSAALEVRERLRGLGLEALCKTTGGKGLHVVSPLSPSRSRRQPGWAETKEFTRQLCLRMAADSPARYIVNMAKSKRAGHIYLDYLRNDRTATAVAPMSTRARDGAPVSMPLSWSQVRKSLDPLRYTLRTAAALLARDRPWEDYCDLERPLVDAMKRLESS